VLEHARRYKADVERIQALDALRQSAAPRALQHPGRIGSIGKGVKPVAHELIAGLVTCPFPAAIATSAIHQAYAGHRELTGIYATDVLVKRDIQRSRTCTQHRCRDAGDSVAAQS